MMKQKITAKQGPILRKSRLAVSLSGLLLIALLVSAGQASAAGPKWDIEQTFPAQVYPGSGFAYQLQVLNVGTTTPSEDLHIHVDAPAGMHFFEPYASGSLSCAKSADQKALDCLIPAGTPIGRYNALSYLLEVENDASLGPRRFHPVFSGGPGAAPPPPSNSRPTTVLATEQPFGIAEVDGVELNEDGSDATQAGGHPWASSTTIRFNTKVVDPGRYVDKEVVPSDSIREVVVDLPAGYVGNPEATPKCTPEQLTRFTGGDGSDIALASCPPDSQVGTIVLELAAGAWRMPVFNVEPQGNAPAQFGFNALGTVVTIFPEVRPNDNGIRVKVQNLSQTFRAFGSTLTLWGSPPDSSHDGLRGRCGGFNGSYYEGNGCPRPSLIPQIGFYVAPTSCLGPLTTSFAARSWTDSTDTGQFTSHDANGNPQGMSGCDRVPFDPKMTARQTADSAATPSGLNFELSVPKSGILNPGGLSQAHLRKAVVKLPEGVTLNPSAAEGLGTCGPAQFQAETLRSDFGAGCPGTSKLGSVQISSPVLPASEVLTGDFFIASPYDNPFNSLIAVYLVVRNVNRGIIVKSAGKVDLDPRTGQIVSTFDNLPQLPFADFELRFREGGRAPLTTPRTCGTYTTEGELTPWSAKANPAANEIAHLRSSYEISRGVGGGPCPAAGLPPFKPGLIAGTLNNRAGTYSPFNVRLFRSDEEQEFTNFSIKLPPGVIGKIAGLGYCSDVAIEAARHRSAVAELASPSCPASSRVGRTLVGAGVGSVLTYVPGALYYAGPYNGSAISLVSVTPAKVGPFDVGTVVVRFAVRVNPETAEIFIDATGSDPIPHIIQGVSTHLRDIRGYVDRPEFALNPTSCARTSTASTVLGAGLDFASAADDQPVTVTSPFQAADCAALGFKPKLALSLQGGTKRGDNPKLKAVLTTRKGDANIGNAQVTLPHSEFLDQSHIKTICTRAQFKAGDVPGEKCPKASIYGYAKAITPLLDEPLQGPVFLRSSSHPLPDLVAALHSRRIDINLAGRIDSVKGGRIRNTFDSVPDAPVTKFTLTMQGGKRGCW